MKYSCLIALVVVSLILSAGNAGALPSGQVARLKQAVESTPPPELPAVVARAIGQAKAADQDAVTELVITTVAQRRSTVLPTVLASIAAALPAKAPAAAASAAKASPQQIPSIVEAACGAAPAFSKEISEAVRQTGSGGASVGTALSKVPAENRPPITPGNIHGNRPEIPPGLAKKQYGSP